MAGETGQTVYEFGDFRLDARRKLLFTASDAEPLSISPKALDLLLFLVQQPGQLHLKNELLDAVWPHVIVEENNLKQCISILRRVLKETPDKHLYIVTEPGRGYRFVAEVKRTDAVPADPTGAGLGSSGAEVRSATIEYGTPELAGSTTRARFLGLAALGTLTIALVLWLGHAGETTSDDPFSGLVDVSEPVPGFSGRAAIAVLPFENLSNDPEQEYFVDGLTRELQTGLESYAIFPIISDATMFRYKGSTDVSAVAEEVGAGYVISAGVQNMAGSSRTRMHVRLNDRSGQQIWADSYDFEIKNTLELQDTLAAQILQELEPELIVTESGRAHRVRSQDMETYDYYLRAITNTLPVFGMTDLNGRQVTPERLEQARADAHAAIALDPGFAAGYRVLNQVEGTYLFALSYLLTEEEWQAAMVRGIEYGESARRLDPFEPTVCSCLAMMYLASDQTERAVLLQEETVRRNPSNAIARAAMATVLHTIGDPERALSEIQTAKRLSPRDLGMSMFLYREASIYQTLGRFDDAISTATRALAFSPGNLNAEFVRVLSLLASDQRDLAEEAVARLEATLTSDSQITSRRERDLPDAVADNIHLRSGESLHGLTYDQGLKRVFADLGWEPGNSNP